MSASMARRTRGFSLLEVLVALGIFSIGLLALVPLFAQASWGTRGGRELTTAKELARTYIERIRNLPYQNIGPCAGSCAIPGAELPGGYSVSFTVTTATGGAYPFLPAAPPDPDMKRITVTVVCATCARQNLTVQMTTLVAYRS